MLTTLFYYGLDGKAGMWFELYHKTKSCDKVWHMMFVQSGIKYNMEPHKA